VHGSVLLAIHGGNARQGRSLHRYESLRISLRDDDSVDDSAEIPKAANDCLKATISARRSDALGLSMLSTSGGRIRWKRRDSRLQDFRTRHGTQCVPKASGTLSCLCTKLSETLTTTRLIERHRYRCRWDHLARIETVAALETVRGISR
jgi:hypothetical protein